MISSYYRKQLQLCANISIPSHSTPFCFSVAKLKNSEDEIFMIWIVRLSNDFITYHLSIMAACMHAEYNFCSMLKILIKQQQITSDYSFRLFFHIIIADYFIKQV